MIEFINVSKEYNHKVKALDNVSFKIEKGDFVFLVGASGSGKSTILKLILKEEEVSEGRLVVNTMDVNLLKQRGIPYYRRKLGVVFQDFRLLPNKTVYDNVAFAMHAVQASKREIKKQVPLILEQVGLLERAKSYPNQLSGGEQQRVALARAIVNNPQILLADEPTGNLDPETAKEIFKLLIDINMKGTTVIIATHAKDTVDDMKKRVIALEKGKILRDDVRGVY